MDFDVSGITGIQLAKPCPGGGDSVPKMANGYVLISKSLPGRRRSAYCAVGVFKITALFMCWTRLEEISYQKPVRKFV